MADVEDEDEQYLEIPLSALMELFDNLYEICEIVTEFLPEDVEIKHPVLHLVPKPPPDKGH